MLIMPRMKVPGCKVVVGTEVTKDNMQSPKATVFQYWDALGFMDCDMC